MECGRIFHSADGELGDLCRAALNALRLRVKGRRRIHRIRRLQHRRANVEVGVGDAPRTTGDAADSWKYSRCRKYDRSFAET